MSSMYRALTVVTAAILGACAQQPAHVIRYGGESQSLALAEAHAIEAAKRHPNAQPRVRPQFPEQAPPPLAAGQTLPAPLHITRRSAPAPAPTNVLVERTVYDDYRPSYGGYGYSYRRPWGVGMGMGWDPYGYGYGYGWPRYGYGYGIGLGISTPLWGYGRGHRLGWSAPRYHHHHHNWGFSNRFGGGGFGGGFRGGSDHVRWVSGRRR